MRFFGSDSRHSAARKRKNNAEWNSFNRNLSSWSTGVTKAASPRDKDKDASFVTKPRPTDRIAPAKAPISRYVEDGKDRQPSFSFRRNATLSNMQSEHRKKTERQRELNLRMRRRQLGILLVIVIGICAIGLLIVSQFSGSFVISSGSVRLTSAQNAYYTNIVDQYFTKNPFERFSFGRRNSNFSEFIQSKAPEVSSVKMSASGLGGGVLELNFRKPLAMWSSGGQTDFVDASGIVFAKNFFANPSVTITDDSGVTPANGQITSSGFLSFIGQVSADLTKNGQILQRVVIPRGAIRYADVYLQGRSYPFMVQIDRDPGSQASDIVASVQYIDQNHITPQYIDVRVAGKMYWK